MNKVIVLLALFSTAAFAQQKGSFTDARDGKSYKTVTIGKQVWIAENLDYAGEDGDIGICSGNDPVNCQKYGRLYDWENAMFACPDGWHLPDNNEWQALADFAGGRETAGRKLKAKGGWEKWDCEWTDMDDRGRMTKFSKCNSDNYGFSALPNSSEGNYGYWWAATENYSGAGVAWMQYNAEDMRQGNDSKSKAYNVRCLKGRVELPSKLVEKRAAIAVAEQAKKAEKAAEIANPLTTEVTDEGTILRGSTLAKKLVWLDRSAESHNTYIIEINANENIAPHTFEYKGAINITIILRGDDENRIIRLQSHGTMFTVHSNATLILDNNITLYGHNQNTGSIIRVSGGNLKMNEGSTIIGNSTNVSYGGGGVHMVGGTFDMSGGNIINNTTTNSGGGVYVGNYFGHAPATFTMNGGTISGNTASEGGGVYVNGTFTLRGGIIEGNIGNEGGGVYGSSEKFTMSNGTITKNIARKYGGGVRMKEAFTKTGGIITGYNSDQSDGNVVRDDDGTIARRGHAVFVRDNKRKETTAGPEDNLSCDRKTSSGAWEEQVAGPGTAKEQAIKKRR